MKLRVEFLTEIQIEDERLAIIDMLETTFKELALPFKIVGANILPPDETVPASQPHTHQIHYDQHEIPQLKRIDCFTDGGCLGPTGSVGAWAYLIKAPTGDVKNAEAVVSTTISRMELTALLRLLEAVTIGTPLRVYSDSEYVVKGCNTWSKSWLKNGWTTANGGEVKNVDLWQPLIKLFELHDIELVHTPGHAGNVGNDTVDKMCTHAMQALVTGSN